ncbi:WYL domain-containing protein [Leptolyngbya sp. FACHB-671]|uniref:WYL domain-containing protein n=1 Tax=Leptolyngbya sp. FACHB-671 TaxID=2692812 RepID=UPI0016825F35|nr:WYL domain-containing protein [Leptolyngbya sp. FACHB-671]MBD2065959.1 WYL domain-containing protein [Leptolyngbya sp. FACHB-671]
MGRRGQSITLSISDKDKEQLEQIAVEQGMMWGDRPNISRLVEAIARRELLIGRNNDWSETRIRVLHQSIQTLIDAGHPESAQIVAQLLAERRELSIPLRSEIDRFLETPLASWRLQIDQYIRRQTPFRLTYRDAADYPWSFTIRHARITPYERRQYLECWCEETEGNQDLPELQHNWILRLDRIPDAAISTVQGQWRSHLDYLEVEMHLLKGLAFAYEAKTADVSNEWLSDRSPPVRSVVRRVSSTFWFFREVFRYGEDCVIVSPTFVQERFKQKLHTLCEQYGLID